ncbi:glucose 1-dehydrogenase [Sporomusa malonica]|nr:glucose 1-dehydrogenase [Sporomusa malonica]
MNVKTMFDLSGKTAIVTGGSTGLGAQMAIAMAEAGANLIIAARKVDRCNEMCAMLEEHGARAIAVACDASKEADCQNLIDVAMKEFGKLDILVNNAGKAWVADSLNFPMDRWQQVINLNLTGTYQLSAMAARVMKEQGGGKIINTASIGGLRGDKPENANSIAYTASKGAVITMTKDLAVKWATYGITVNAICPGWFPTSMNDQLLEQNRKNIMPRIPLNRYGGENDLKGVIVFLASAASNYMTGQCVVVDGGQTALL